VGHTLTALPVWRQKTARHKCQRHSGKDVEAPRIPPSSSPGGLIGQFGKVKGVNLWIPRLIITANNGWHPLINSQMAYKFVFMGCCLEHRPCLISINAHIFVSFGIPMGIWIPIPPSVIHRFGEVISFHFVNDQIWIRFE
jgi:hypothetical protein